MDGDGGLASVLSVYHALSEIASDFACDEFTTMQSHVGKISGGLSISTVKRCIKELRELKVISYELSRLRGPLKFKLLRDGSQISNDRSQMPYDGSFPNLGEVISSRRNIEENKERVVDKKPKKSKSPTQPLPPIPNELDTPAFRTAWDEWIQHRKEKNKALTPSTASKHLKQLGGWGAGMAVAALDKAIHEGWQGFYEPKDFVPTTDQTVPRLSKSKDPEGWIPVFTQLYPSGTVMPWDQLTQIHPEIADEVRKTISDQQSDTTSIAQNTP